MVFEISGICVIDVSYVTSITYITYVTSVCSSADVRRCIIGTFTGKVCEGELFTAGDVLDVLEIGDFLAEDFLVAVYVEFFRKDLRCYIKRGNSLLNKGEKMIKIPKNVKNYEKF
jgi:hypothetical protein